MPTIGDINVKISADDSDFRRKAKSTKERLAEMGRVSLKAGKGIAALGAAATASAGAFAVFATSQANINRELRSMSRLANTSAEEFKALSFASRQYGIEQEKLADILKDTQDKVGDFIATGGGALKDFFDNIAPQIGLTAQQFMKLSGPDAMQAYVSALEKANVSQSEMTFYMEAIASDSTKLLPLFKNQGREIQRLTQSYSEVNSQLELTSAQKESLQELSTSFELFKESAGSSAQLIAATLAPAFSDFFSGVAKIVPKATQVIVDFFNKFKDAQNINNISSVEREIEKLTKRISKMNDVIAKEKAMGVKMSPYGQMAKFAQEIEQDTKRVEALREQLAKLQEEEKLADAKTYDAGGFSVRSGATPRRQGLEQAGKPMPTGFINTASDEFGFNPSEDPFQMEIEMTQQKHQELLELERQFWTNKGEITRHGLTALTSMVSTNYGSQAGAIANSFASILGDTATYSKKAFDLNQKVSLGQAIVKGYDAANSAWAAGMATGGPWAPAVAASYFAASVAKTATQIQAIRSQKFGGGGSGSAGGGTGGASGALPGASVPQQANVRQNTVATINLQGDTFSRDTVGALIGQINNALEDGYSIRVNS